MRPGRRIGVQESVTRSFIERRHPTRRWRLAIALVLAAVGIVWVGQGAGFIGGSAMTGSRFWAGAGALLLAAAAVAVVLERRFAGRR